MESSGRMTTLVEFTGTGGSNKGSSPRSSLIQGTDGNFYGITEFGGASNMGTVFKLTRSGIFTTLVQFSDTANAKGSFPKGGLIEGIDGSFYGTTSAGGATNSGTVFKVTSNGVVTTLVEFDSGGSTNRGASPTSRLLRGNDGYFYGTTSGGGTTGNGTVFKMTPSGILTTLVDFTNSIDSNSGVIGRQPLAELVQATDGRIYGTTSAGGAANDGTVFSVSTAGFFTTLSQFTNNGGTHVGSDPKASLVLATDGNLYGTTASGGLSDRGTIFKLTPSGAITTLVEFTGITGLNKGSAPTASLVQVPDGNFYGATSSGGINDLGTVFKVTPAGMLTTLIEFTGGGGGNRGGTPLGGVVRGSDGNFYGTTAVGGTDGKGTIFKMTPSGVLTTLVDFTGVAGAAPGAAPNGRLIEGTDGRFYGTTSVGGASDVGTIFAVTPSGLYQRIVNFSGTTSGDRGAFPVGGLLLKDNFFYGTTF
jgi:uncharacterized repeat protein (TIGR03803 family)